METAALVTLPAMFTRSTCGHFLAARAGAMPHLPPATAALPCCCRCCCCCKCGGNLHEFQCHSVVCPLPALSAPRGCFVLAAAIASSDSGRRGGGGGAAKGASAALQAAHPASLSASAALSAAAVSAAAATPGGGAATGGGGALLPHPLPLPPDVPTQRQGATTAATGAVAPAAPPPSPPQLSRGATPGAAAPPCQRPPCQISLGCLGSPPYGITQARRDPRVRSHLARSRVQKREPLSQRRTLRGTEVA